MRRGNLRAGLQKELRNPSCREPVPTATKLSNIVIIDYEKSGINLSHLRLLAVHRLIQSLGETAKMPFRIHPHMLRHACGYKLANDGHDTRALQHYLGHKNIQHTVRYTELAVDRFKDFWR